MSVYSLRRRNELYFFLATQGKLSYEYMIITAYIILTKGGSAWEKKWKSAVPGPQADRLERRPMNKPQRQGGDTVGLETGKSHAKAWPGSRRQSLGSLENGNGFRLSRRSTGKGRFFRRERPFFLCTGYGHWVNLNRDQSG